MTNQGMPLAEVPDLDVSIGLQDTGGGNWVVDGDVMLGVIYILVVMM